MFPFLCYRTTFVSSNLQGVYYDGSGKTESSIYKNLTYTVVIILVFVNWPMSS